MKATIKTTMLLGTLCAMIACKKDDVTISEVPEISVESVSPVAVQEFKDSIVFTVSYKDGDGDLGENTAGVENLFIKDTRNDVVFGYRIPQLAPDGSTIAIQGRLRVTLNSTSITDQSASQQVVYEVYAVDRAGHTSNVATTSAVTVMK
ncbi:MAG: hypothetical protein H6585_12825 [Flavobacteriales bacterium]|nr:hypothetical protein [Flavobacteriales bacterium]MCB9449215.1 hypothetical protein [Flavobacteriales bacterium]